MKYTESIEQSTVFKENYRDSILKLIKSRQKYAKDKREIYAKDILTDTERYREDFKKMLGWPLVDCDGLGVPDAEFTELSKEDGYTLYRVHINTVEDLKLTGLFFRLDTDEKKPLVIVQHGGQGTPEFISGMYNGRTSNYNDMLMRVLKRGVHVFAPQLLIWNPSEHGADFDRSHIDAHLKRVGSSIAALEVHAITRVIDYFEAQDFVSEFGMVGLSYGGFYTLFTAAADTRIKSAVSCSYFNDRDEHIFTNWTWKGSALKFNDAEVACLVYPRRICLQMGNCDELFNSDFSIGSFEQIKQMCKDVGTDWVELVVFDGKHEFCKDDKYIDILINDLK